MSKQLMHDYDDNGICRRCGFDGADHAWQMMVLRSEVGDDEVNHRQSMGEFDFAKYCKPGHEHRG